MGSGVEEGVCIVRNGMGRWAGGRFTCGAGVKKYQLVSFTAGLLPVAEPNLCVWART